MWRIRSSRCAFGLMNAISNCISIHKQYKIDTIEKSSANISSTLKRIEDRIDDDKEKGDEEEDDDMTAGDED